MGMCNARITGGNIQDSTRAGNPPLHPLSLTCLRIRDEVRLSFVINYFNFRFDSNKACVRLCKTAELRAPPLTSRTSAHKNQERTWPSPPISPPSTSATSEPARSESSLRPGQEMSAARCQQTIPPGWRRPYHRHSLQANPCLLLACVGPG
ncbi:hypothetical protein GY45DRAFT_1332665 [Cubamyces sp. BRFM 1775]|nr:hypothetical protein GY45DRAFT_1332665 [Cubamyces sp. BRFM 1775]